jgi:hypothetical protein
MHFVLALKFAIIALSLSLNSKGKIGIILNHIYLIYSTL